MSIRMESWILEACILAMLEHEDAYGYRLAKFNELNIAESTVYPALRRLAAKGYLNVSSQMYGSKLRKYYTITPDGQEQLMRAKKRG